MFQCSTTFRELPSKNFFVQEEARGAKISQQKIRLAGHCAKVVEHWNKPVFTMFLHLSLFIYNIIYIIKTTTYTHTHSHTFLFRLFHNPFFSLEHLEQTFTPS
jgi:hypothetical protein